MNVVTVLHLEMALTACVVVAVRQAEAASLALRLWAPSQHGMIDLGGAGECACRYGLGSVLCGHSGHTAVDRGHASPCGYEAASGSSWCTGSADNGAALAQHSTEK